MPAFVPELTIYHSGGLLGGLLDEGVVMRLAIDAHPLPKSFLDINLITGKFGPQEAGDTVPMMS